MIRTPLCYGQFVWSQKCQESYIPHLYNTDTCVKQHLVLSLWCPYQRGLTVFYSALVMLVCLVRLCSMYVGTLFCLSSHVFFLFLFLFIFIFNCKVLTYNTYLQTMYDTYATNRTILYLQKILIYNVRYLSY